MPKTLFPCSLMPSGARRTELGYRHRMASEDPTLEVLSLVNGKALHLGWAYKTHVRTHMHGRTFDICGRPHDIEVVDRGPSAEQTLGKVGEPRRLWIDLHQIYLAKADVTHTYILSGFEDYAILTEAEAFLLHGWGIPVLGHAYTRLNLDKVRALIKQGALKSPHLIDIIFVGSGVKPP